MNAFLSWIEEYWFAVLLVCAVVTFLVFFIAVIIGQQMNTTARNEWCYEQGYFEVASTPTSKFICVDFRKEKDSTLAIPESVWKGE